MKKSQVVKYYLDLKTPVSEEVIELADFEKYLHDSLKVDGKKGNLGTKVTISKDKYRINVTAELPFSKGYLKYLSKLYLKKEALRNFLRVVATTKAGYEFKYLGPVAGGAED